ncbi:ribosome hibernation-promoting factor, HPF/YfiA family [Spirochaeta cellobiosiphila]|uniref:ribosome hibernation-promoting factor, HPF/YfiA family n=1 Tax=Spirochaeta cellobiosiphila TaxID=504483 RepID=UPI00040B6F46|nr:ribosome-associated translation inhibitor RaiA [Spirochaeta cellobiosiphila]
MNLTVKAVHYNLSDTTRDFIDKKLEKLNHVKEIIVDFALTITKEKQHYRAEATIHYRWNKDAHFHDDEKELYKAIEILIDKVELATTKEKEKIKTHTGVDKREVVEE